MKSEIEDEENPSIVRGAGFLLQQQVEILERRGLRTDDQGHFRRPSTAPHQRMHAQRVSGVGKNVAEGSGHHEQRGARTQSRGRRLSRSAGRHRTSPKRASSANTAAVAGRHMRPRFLTPPVPGSSKRVVEAGHVSKDDELLLSPTRVPDEVVLVLTIHLSKAP